MIHDDEDLWAELEALEAARMDADLEMAEMEAVGDAIAATRRAGRCAHQGAIGYLPGEDRGLKPGQLRCNDSGHGCGQVWNSDEEWFLAMDAAITASDNQGDTLNTTTAAPAEVIYTKPTGNRTAGRIHRATCKHIPKGATQISPAEAGVDALLDASKATCCSVREADREHAITVVRSAELATAGATIAAEAADGSTVVIAQTRHVDIAPVPAAQPAESPDGTSKNPRTFDATTVTEFTCEGACGETLPVNKFPTITGTVKRVVECRTCRNARTKAAKAAKAGAR